MNQDTKELIEKVSKLYIKFKNDKIEVHGFYHPVTHPLPEKITRLMEKAEKLSGSDWDELIVDYTN